MLGDFLVVVAVGGLFIFDDIGSYNESIII